MDSSQDNSKKRLLQLRKETKDIDPVFSEALIRYYLGKSGCEVADEGVYHLASIYLHQFVSQTLEDCKQVASLQQQKKKVKTETEQEEQGQELRVNDLQTVLKSKKITVSAAPYQAL